MAKGLDKGAAQLRIEGQCREMNFGGAYAELAADLGIKAEREVCPTCRGSGSDGGRQYPDGQYEAFKCESCDGFGTAQGCTLCGSNDHSTTGCPMRAQAAPVGGACAGIGKCQDQGCPAHYAAEPEPVSERGLDTKGGRKALGAMNAKLKAKIGRLERELAAYQRQSGVVVPHDLLIRVLEPVTSEQYINSKHELLALMREFAHLNGVGSHE